MNRISENIKKQRVILIEDDDTTMSVISDFLEDEGFDIICFESPDKAVDEVQPNDILIIDVRFEKINSISAGVDFIISLRARKPEFNNTKTIFISNFGRTRIENKLQQLNPNSFIWLDKPFGMNLLDHAIRR
jgi:DNA-binding response OmpR family regulator